MSASVLASTFAAHLFWDLELPHINGLMLKLLFKVTGPQPEQSVKGTVMGF